MKHKVISIEQISSGFVNQFEGLFEDGDELYIRAKLDLYIYKFPKNGTIEDWDDYDLILGFDVPDDQRWGHSYHEMTVQDVIQICKDYDLPIEFNLKKNPNAPNQRRESED